MARDGIMWSMREPDYLTAAESAARLGISLRTARRRIADGSLPSVRIGHAVRIPAAALDLPPAGRAGAAAREAVVRYATDVHEDRAAYIARWNASHWPDTFERTLERRRRAFDRLDAIRATTRPPSGPHDTVDAILDAVRDEFGSRFDWIIAGLPEPPEES
jgi:excisionase family DNA binding protein